MDTQHSLLFLGPQVGSFRHDLRQQDKSPPKQTRNLIFFFLTFAQSVILIAFAFENRELSISLIVWCYVLQTT